MSRFLVRGFALWLVGTILLRLAPGRLVQPGRTGAVLILFAVSFLLALFLLGRRLVRALPPAEARLALIALVLPTLVLDAFTSAFFPVVFPNLPATAAGVFGGWMLISCAGALAAALLPR